MAKTISVFHINAHLTRCYWKKLIRLHFNDDLQRMSRNYLTSHWGTIVQEKLSREQLSGKESSQNHPWRQTGEAPARRSTVVRDIIMKCLQSYTCYAGNKNGL